MLQYVISKPRNFPRENKVLPGVFIDWYHVSSTDIEAGLSYLVRT